MKAKQATALCLAVILLFAAVPAASAVTPFWTNVNSVTVVITSSGTSANCIVSITGLSGSTITDADVTLYKKNASGTYVYQTAWNDQSSTTNTLSFSQPYTVVSGATYKLSVTADILRNGVTETVINSHERTIP
jgi:hypothetical protein